MFSPKLMNSIKYLSKLQSCSTHKFGVITHRYLSSNVKELTSNDIKVTEKALNQLKEIVENGERLRVEVDGGGCSGFEYKIRLDKQLNPDDLIWKNNGAEIVIDEISLGYIKGATVDFVEDLMKSAFRVVDNPVAEKGCSCGSSFALKMD